MQPAPCWGRMAAATSLLKVGGHQLSCCNMCWAWDGSHTPKCSHEWYVHIWYVHLWCSMCSHCCCCKRRACELVNLLVQLHMPRGLTWAGVKSEDPCFSPWHHCMKLTLPHPAVTPHRCCSVTCTTQVAGAAATRARQCCTHCSICASCALTANALSCACTAVCKGALPSNHHTHCCSSLRNTQCRSLG
jgi:hypothetical protein